MRWRQLMLVPTLGCQASCRYCFGPRDGDGVMSAPIVEAAARWQAAQGGGDGLEITFHGGEPLLAGAAFFRAALPCLREGLRPRRVRFGVQSNLWRLDDELCEVFAAHGVAVGTSLDGPEPLCDAQRGRGYFRRTMAGIDRARNHGLTVGCICTFTAASAPHAPEIFDFFHREGLDFTVHAAVPSVRGAGDGYHLDAEVFGEVLVALADRYLERLDRVRVGTLDALARSIAVRHGGICTFTDCLGGYLAVVPDGSIVPCQRFAGLAEFRLGHVFDTPGPDELAAAPAWRRLRRREEMTGEACGDCTHFELCRGGCPYNVLAARGTLADDVRDPHCAAFRRIFSHLTDRALAEVFAAANLDRVVEAPRPEHGLLRRGQLLPLMRAGGPHPVAAARGARRVLVAVAAAHPADAEVVATSLAAAGVRDVGPAAISAFRARLAAPVESRNNLYLHVTFACNLGCSHCYAEAGDPRGGAMPVATLAAACTGAARLGFRQVVITGGEPLVHPDRDALLDSLAAVRESVKPLLTVLRTNLAVAADGPLLARIGTAFDQVVVSIDGDERSHDARRGAGAWARTVANLRALVALGPAAAVSIAAVMPAAAIGGVPGDAVRALARELGLRRTRFRPLLPIGRAAGIAGLAPETPWGHLEPYDLLGGPFTPAASCGLGQNLYVEPDGGAYACYALNSAAARLGTVAGSGDLTTIVASEGYRDLAAHTVDSNRRCRGCALRYLCSGACRAWDRGTSAAEIDLDAAPLDCAPLHARSRDLLVAALDHLAIPAERWTASGLPLPGSPPDWRA